MVEVFVPLGALAMMSLFIAQLCRLVSHATLNRTIRKALDTDPPSARLLIEKLERRTRWSGGLVGWIMVVVGIAAGAIGLTGPNEDPTDTIQVAIVSIVVGLGFLSYAWWAARSTPALVENDAA